MPFKSEKQRRYLWRKHPKMAQKWTDEHGSKPVKKKDGGLPKLDKYYGSYIKGTADGHKLSNPTYRKYYKGLI